MRLQTVVLSLLATVWGGCAGLDDFDDRSPVSADLKKRTGRGVGMERKAGEADLPDGVHLGDGITEDEAVALALWNNAAFQEALMDLGFARADLIEAGLLKNPVLSVLFPLGPKQLEFAATLPLEALWLRWSRKDIARLELDRVSATLVQEGLNLIRTVRASHADVLRREEEARLAARAAEVREEIAVFFAARLRAGDVSELEVGLARVDALEARQEAKSRQEEVAASRERFRELLGLTDLLAEPRVVSQEADPVTPGKREALLSRALASRPDLRAAELSLEVAGERAGLADWECFALSGIVDANDPRGKDSLEVGPGLETTIPIFNWNQGGKALADARVRKAALHYVTVRHAIARELGEALVRDRQARETLIAYREGIVPGLSESLIRSRSAWEGGQTSELPVLRTEARLLAARMKEAEALAAVRSARANLERSLGSRLESEDRR